MPSLVVVPATPLLVCGASGEGDAVPGLRDAVRSVLAREVAQACAVAVLAHGPVARSGRLRPTLAGAGIADAHVPLARSLAGCADAAWDGWASTGASIALFALADAGLALAARAVDVVETPAQAPAATVRAAADRLLAALRGSPSAAARAMPGLIVVADQPSPGVDAVLAQVTAHGRWSHEARDAPARHEHLPGSYRVTVRRLVT
ncbi:hypothetical protein [Xylanimonas ulmi]|uniref:Uncharacterized protein n=1 Tax=Xylanimonas ulmi TaxID=228973 RepID=A0A4Q7M498_9MICO|nr:hypothetical protein [Xylanibacterium ulmi]RZS61328.1 hypothetical protein EV386_1626 [Xylanibacterium ulmi]